MIMRNRHIHKWIAAMLLAMAIGGAVWWHISFNPRFFPVIENQVYRSAQLSASRLETVIQTHGIRSIIALLGSEKGATWYENEKAVAERHQLNLLNIGFSSHELPPYNRLNQLVEALLTAPRPILLHCYRGADRTGMASAIALILNDDPPLETIEKQFSWRFGVIPHSDSIGVLFFNQYSEWLHAIGKVHSRDVFLDWIRNCYVDPKGNIEYDIDSINDNVFEDSKWKDGRVATVRKGAGRYVVRGWAADYRGLSRADFLQVGIGKTFRQAVYTTQRPDLPASLGLSGVLNPLLPLGWECEFDDRDMSPGCQNIQLSIGGPGSVKTVIHTRIHLCIEESGK
ncbi:MAG: tyrosine-protein phosphatase [Pseudomonadota bacterium]